MAQMSQRRLMAEDPQDSSKIEQDESSASIEETAQTQREKVEQSEEDEFSFDISDYFSSHPPSEDRIEKFTKASKSLNRDENSE